MGEGGGTPPEIVWLLLYIEGRARCVSCWGLGCGDGVCGVELVWRCCGQMLKNTRKYMHSKAYAQTHICGVILCTLNIHI